MSVTVVATDPDEDEDEAVPTFRFETLSDRAKAAALDAIRHRDVDYDWWDNTYEDAVRMAAILGIEIGTEAHRYPSGHTVTTPKISFSGFGSQGDGACFSGSYSCAPEAIAKITAECNDAKLLDLAMRLTTIQVAANIQYGCTVEAQITTSGNYLHSGTMNVETSYTDGIDETFKTLDALDVADAEITACMREFADWIYIQLESGHDYLTSDEHLSEYLTGDENLFDEDGKQVV